MCRRAILRILKNSSFLGHAGKEVQGACTRTCICTCTCTSRCIGSRVDFVLGCVQLDAAVELRTQEHWSSAQGGTCAPVATCLHASVLLRHMCCLASMFSYHMLCASNALARTLNLQRQSNGS